ncbi:TrkA-C domain protein [Alkaliphilus metalliredigens QYMF]|uniref:TrkA-C domain protein n=1 Tax=Alkaliphilus metalliredigens (strain QYMF) TaxID=293826 RepID=A6TU25_ALKMQ|nr:TrkA C-terminal domain-containing protein [Alkaliphilus metalliredigens]ABR49693.1 TrkA-C domain protein [Alkaliphilus metalliredigens QYMF]
MTITYGFIILIFIALVVEILSIALKITGLDMDKARFQVVSILTGTGFTTRESELITQHPTRRKIALVLMLISYVGTAVFIGIIFSALRTNESFVYFFAYAGVVILLTLFFLRNKYILHRFESIIERQLLKQMNINRKYKTAEEVLNLNDEYGVAEFIIDEDSGLLGSTLEKSGLKQNYIQVLNIDRGGKMIHFPKHTFVFQSGDKLVVYGQIENIKEFIVKDQNDVDN